jgi:hypothetical protein
MGPGAVAVEPGGCLHIFEEAVINEGDNQDWKWSIPLPLSSHQLSLLLPLTGSQLPFSCKLPLSCTLPRVHRFRIYFAQASHGTILFERLQPGWVEEHP